MIKVSLNHHTNLSLGDFEQVVRRTKLAPAKSPIELLEQLESGPALKNSGIAGTTGFLAAA